MGGGGLPSQCLLYVAALVLNIFIIFYIEFSQIFAKDYVEVWIINYLFYITTIKLINSYFISFFFNENDVIY